MGRLRIGGRLATLWLMLWLAPAAVAAQNTGIAGVVKDTSGAVLPGVTVEAQSPVLIEKVRTVVTDAQGLYSIIDLRPGTYSVTFTLAGFSTIKREGVELTGSFTATVNADLMVGAVSETLTVTGEAPNVDTRNVVQLKVMTEDVRETLPTGRSVLYIATLIPGTTRTTTVGRNQDLAGTSDSRGASMIHGGRSQDYMLQYDGSPTDLSGGGSGQSWQTNPGEIQEFVYELGSLSAESAFGGVRANIIPKDGGNRFAGQFFYAISGENFQSDNLTPELEKLGVISTVKLKKHWDGNVSVGGPIKRDRLWFFSSYRNQGNDEGIVGMYEAINPRSVVFDPAKGAAGNVDVNKPAIYLARNYYYSSRFTWQATPRNKVGVYLSSQPRHNYGFRSSGTVSAESSSNQEFGNQLFGTATCGRSAGSGTGLYDRTKDHRDSEGCGPLVLDQVSWKSPITSKLLVEAVYAFNDDWGCRCVPFGSDFGHLYPGTDNVAIIDAGTGYTYRAGSATYDWGDWRHDSAKASLSYVTGAHAFKVGGSWEWGFNELIDSFHNQNMTFQFRNGAPTGITVYNEPWTDWNGWQKVGLFGQDQWTFRRLTANAGVRLDLHKGFTGDNQTSGPNAYAPFQRWTKLENVPNWKDISPRFGVAYDLFGTGRTALKYTLSRYVVNSSTDFPASVNPIRFNQSATRSWTDTRVCAGGIPNDFVPQECELGTLSNSAFATAATTTRVDDAVREGWGVRQYDWETTASIQHQLLESVSVNFGFTRRWFNKFSVTDNLALVPADYDEFCITAPSDSRLGSASGSRICGLYDLNPAKRTLTPNNLVTDASHYGTQKEYWSGIDLNMQARIMNRATIQGGLNSGTAGNSTEACFVVDNPGALRFCNVQRPWRTNVRFLGNVELPWGINTGVTFVADPQNEILATYGLANADITSGVVQFVNPARTTFGSGSASVNLLEPGTMFQDYLYEVDIRLSKAFAFRGLRARVTLDLANLNNSAAVITQNNTFGANWQRPTYLLPGRLIKPGFQLEF